ncbi:MAG: 2-amino-4-hydroxy-6-hydroxymethyldihydropteridine diphosphokinase [Bacteroidota bacterium]
MHTNHRLFLGTGTNLGDRKNNLNQALQFIKEYIGDVNTQSNIYQSKAWGKTDQPDFFNQVLEVFTNQEPQQVLENCLSIEQQMGRVRIEKWGTRIIDIDVLFYNDLVLNHPNLIIPHPFLQDRSFVLKPMAEIAPEFVHPVLRETIKNLLEKIEVENDCKKIRF